MLTAAVDPDKGVVLYRDFIATMVDDQSQHAHTHTHTHTLVVQNTYKFRCPLTFPQVIQLAEGQASFSEIKRETLLYHGSTWLYLSLQAIESDHLQRLQPRLSLLVLAAPPQISAVPPLQVSAPHLQLSFSSFSPLGREKTSNKQLTPTKCKRTSALNQQVLQVL